MLGLAKRLHPHIHAILNARIAHRCILAHIAQNIAQVVTALEQQGQLRRHHRRRPALAGRQIERERLRVLGAG